MKGTYSKENRSPARPSQRTPAIYKFALLVVYSDHKRCFSQYSRVAFCYRPPSRSNESPASIEFMSLMS
jgi:hypothetical protein